jgi:hypothetical protein
MNETQEEASLIAKYKIDTAALLERIKAMSMYSRLELPNRDGVFTVNFPADATSIASLTGLVKAYGNLEINKLETRQRKK